MNSPLQRLQAFWNERYASEDFVYGAEPNTFLVSQARDLPPNAEVLCLADGEGRNGVWLAQQGARVSSWDVAESGLDKARRLAADKGVHIDTRCTDVTTADIGLARWDLIASIFLHLPAAPRRDLHRRCMQGLKPGGRFVFEAYGAGQLARATGGPREAALLPTLAEVEADVQGLPGLRVLHRFQGVRAVHEGPLHAGDGEVVQLVVQRL